MGEIVADLRDDLVAAFTDWDLNSGPMKRSDYVEGLADAALITIKRWCAKEPTNDN